MEYSFQGASSGNSFGEDLLVVNILSLVYKCWYCIFERDLLFLKIFSEHDKSSSVWVPSGFCNFWLWTLVPWIFTWECLRPGIQFSFRENLWSHSQMPVPVTTRKDVYWCVLFTQTCLTMGLGLKCSGFVFLPPHVVPRSKWLSWSPPSPYHLHSAPFF